MRADAEAALFSVKCFVAAMLAYYIALRIGLTRPYWAIGSVYLVSQPLAGAAVSRAIFRLLGTMLGATAAERKPNSRLSCQIRMKPELAGLIVRMPDRQY